MLKLLWVKFSSIQPLPPNADVMHDLWMIFNALVITPFTFLTSNQVLRFVLVMYLMLCCAWMIFAMWHLWSVSRELKKSRASWRDPLSAQALKNRQQGKLPIDPWADTTDRGNL